jgi:hypothetical protein
MKRLAIVVVAVAVLSGCAIENHKASRGRGDTGIVEVDGTEAYVIEMPNGFANVATKCIWEGVRAFSGTGDEGKGIAVIADPGCEQPPYEGQSR